MPVITIGSCSQSRREAAGIFATYLWAISEAEYCGPDGTTLMREHGVTPGGNPINGRWTLRAPDGRFVRCDQYRNEIAKFFGLHLSSVNLVRR